MKNNSAINKAIVIYDEAEPMRELQGLMELYCPQVKLIATLPLTEESKNIILNIEPSILFLNIAASPSKCLQFLSDLKENKFHLIITTHLEQLPLQAFRLKAVDYLTKPIKPEELKSVIEHLLQKSSSDLKNAPVENSLKHQGEKEPLQQRIAFPHARGYKFVTLKDIICCKSISNYTILYLVGESEFTVCKTLGQMEEILTDDNFVRIHRSFLINTKRILEYVKSDGGFLIMENGFHVPVSRNNKVQLAEILHAG